MEHLIKGLHHVTSMAADPVENNAFFTKTLGLRRVKKTVNFDAPEVYHLYYGDAAGTPGSVMTYFPFSGMPKGVHGAGEVGETRVRCCRRRAALLGGPTDRHGRDRTARRADVRRGAARV